MRRRSKFVAVTLVLSAPAMAQLTQPQMLDAARSISRVLGLSPAGTELWARQAVKRASSDEYDGVTQVETEIGRELARSFPDRRRLNALVEQYAVQSAEIQRKRKSAELDDAFQHTPADRQRIGKFMEKSARESLKRESPILRPLP